MSSKSLGDVNTTVITSNFPAVSKDSALRASIATKGSNSYYYAHAQTVADARSFAPRKLGGIMMPCAERTKQRFVDICKYSWDNTKDYVKIYINTEGIQAKVCSNNVKCKFEDSRFTLCIEVMNHINRNEEREEQNFNSSLPIIHRLQVSNLNAPINTEQSRWKTCGDNMIIISLRKTKDQKWFTLRAKKA